MLRKRNSQVKKVESKAGHRKRLRSVHALTRCSALGINHINVPDSSMMEKEEALDYLASLIVEVFLDMKKDEYLRSQQSNSTR